MYIITRQSVRTCEVCTILWDVQMPVPCDMNVHSTGPCTCASADAFCACNVLGFALLWFNLQLTCPGKKPYDQAAFALESA